MKKLIFLILISFYSTAQTNYTLQKTLQVAKANNPVLKAEFLNISIAEADIVTAKLHPNPILNNQSLQLADPAYFPANSSYNDGRTRQIWWQLTKPFQLPAQRKYKIDFAKKKVVFSQSRYKETERNLLFRAASKWLDVWSAKKQLELIGGIWKKTDSLFNVNKELQSVGLLSVQYALKTKLAEQDHKNEIQNLKLVLGIKDNIDIDATDNFTWALSANMDTLLQQALNTRGDILVLRSEIEVSNSNIKLQRALSRPSPELGAIYNPQNLMPYAGVFGTIQIPIFSRNQGEIRKSNLLKQQAEQNLEATQQQIQTEITIAVNSYKTQKQIVEDYKNIFERSETILKTAVAADYLETQRTRLEIQAEYNIYLHQYYQSCVNLLYVSGLINKIAE